MNFSELFTIGDEAFPTITIVGMVQGNDLYGSRVLGELQKINTIRHGKLQILYAHLPAAHAGKRQIKIDLNRSFPGREHGMLEHRIAYQLRDTLRKSQVVIDIHTSDEEHQPYVLLTTSETTAEVAASYAHSDISIMDRRIADLGQVGEIASCTGISQRIVLPSALSAGSSVVDYVNSHGNGYGILLQVGSFRGRSAIEIATDAVHTFLKAHYLLEGIPSRADTPEVYLGQDFTATRGKLEKVSPGELTTAYCPSFQEEKPFLKVKRMS